MKKPHLDTEEYQHLKLAAHTEEEVHILSAYIQDSLLPVSCIHWSEEDKSLTILIIRFCWERNPIHYNEDNFYERVHSGVHFINVESADFSEVENLHPSHLLSLLNLNKQSDHLNITFSKHTHIFLQGKNIKVFLKDLNEPYITEFKPNHG